MWLIRTIPLPISIAYGSRAFSTSAVALSKRSQLRKPNMSTLTKHLKPDGLTGKQRRNVLRERLKQPSRSTTAKGPYIPIKRRLEGIDGNNGNNQVHKLSEFLATQTFEDLGLSPSIVTAARAALNQPEAQPTEIQALAIPKVLQTPDTASHHVLCAAETGSGKTLAYLLPVIHLLKKAEETQDARRRLDHPRAVVLVPTRELITQVIKTCKSLAHTAKFRALGLDGRTPRARMVQTLADGPVDVLVTTPTTVRSFVKDGVLSLADLQYLVVDEADSLFDAGWEDDCRALIRQMQEVNQRFGRHEKILIVSATLPRSVHSVLDALFPKLVKITTPSLHRALPNLKQSFVDLTRFNGNRQLALLDVLKKNAKRDTKTLVFCNTKRCVELLHQWMASKHVPALALYKDAPMGREEALQRFSDPNGSDHILISTDIASRGIDTTFVDHVVLFDFPSSVVDYLHRVGRTARAGQTGKATALIGRKDKMMADRIQRAIREGAIMT